MRLTSRTCWARPLPGWAATFSQIQQSCITVQKRSYLAPWPQGTLNIQILVHWINISNTNNNNRTYHLLSTCHLPGERCTYHLYSSYTFCKAGVTISTLQLRKLKFRKIMWLMETPCPPNIRMSWDSYPFYLVTKSAVPLDLAYADHCAEYKEVPNPRSGAWRADSWTCTWLKSWEMQNAWGHLWRRKAEEGESESVRDRCVQIQLRSKWMAAFKLTEMGQAWRKEQRGSERWDTRGQYTNKPGLSK